MVNGRAGNRANSALFAIRFIAGCSFVLVPSMLTPRSKAGRHASAARISCRASSRGTRAKATARCLPMPPPPPPPPMAPVLLLLLLLLLLLEVVVMAPVLLSPLALLPQAMFAAVVLANRLPRPPPRPWRPLRGVCGHCPALLRRDDDNGDNDDDTLWTLLLLLLLLLPSRLFSSRNHFVYSSFSCLRCCSCSRCCWRLRCWLAALLFE